MNNKNIAIAGTNPKYQGRKQTKRKIQKETKKK
jgi:hypothetical protein